MPAQASPRNAFYWLVLASLFAGATMVLPSINAGPLAWFPVLISMASSYLLFLWYCRDGNLRHFRRTIWWNIGMVSTGWWVAFPLYLWRTRARGQRLRAIGKAILCGMLLLLATGIGAALASFGILLSA